MKLPKKEYELSRRRSLTLFAGKTTFTKDLVFIFIIIIVSIIISSEVSYIIQNSVLVEFLLLIIILKSILILIFFFFIVYNSKLINKTTLKISLFLSIAVFFIVIFEELQTVKGYSQTNFLPLTPSNISLLPCWLLDFANIITNRIISKISILGLSFLILIIGFTFTFLIIQFLVKNNYIININFIESLEVLFPIIIIFEIFLSILSHSSHITYSSIIICSLCTIILIFNKQNRLIFEEKSREYIIVVFWFLNLFLSNPTASKKVIDSFILYLNINIPFIENFLIILTLMLFFIFYTKIMQNLDTKVNFQLNVLIISEILISFYVKIILQPFLVKIWIFFWAIFLIAIFTLFLLIYFKLTMKDELSIEEASMSIILPFVLLLYGY